MELGSGTGTLIAGSRASDGRFIIRKAAYRLTREEIGRIKEKAIAVGVDHKDGDLADVDLSLFDFHVSASKAGFDAMNELLSTRPEAKPGAFSGLLYQAADARLARFQRREFNGLSPVYVGAPDNAVIPGSMRELIPVYPVGHDDEMDAAVRDLSAFNFHFAVRPGAKAGLRRAYKPFTKGANAAACHSNVLVNRQVDDAVHFLTPDHPYLVRSNRAEDVEEAFRKARDEVGGPEWQRGLDIRVPRRMSHCGGLR